MFNAVNVAKFYIKAIDESNSKGEKYYLRGGENEFKKFY